MSRCSLYTPEQNRKGTDKERHPTTLKPEEYGEIPYEYAKEHDCGSCANSKVSDCEWFGIFYCKVRRMIA